VLTFRISFGYCTTGEDLEKHVRRCAGEIKDPFERTMCFYGVGNHGGGPTRKNIESILRLNADPGFPELIFDTPDGFFELVSASGLPFPTVHDGVPTDESLPVIETNLLEREEPEQ
jgi:alpha-mannosidase